MRKTVVQNLVAYAIAALIVCYAARGVSRGISFSDSGDGAAAVSCAGASALLVMASIRAQGARIGWNIKVLACRAPSPG